MRHEPAPTDRLVAEIAARQHGVVSLVQLVSVGIRPNGVSRRVRAGPLRRIHRGVYAVGHTALTKEGRWLAAVLACGKGAALSHRSAAALWELRPVPAGPIDVIVATRAGRERRPGLRVHRPSCRPRAEVTRHRGIPVTTPARTIRDLRRVLRPDQLEAVIRRAEVLRLPIGQQAEYAPDLTRSELERRFLRLCRKLRLPAPQVNVWAGPFEVDFLWATQRLIVELDGYRHHGTRHGFESDRDRDARLKVMGYEVLRFTHRQLAGKPGWVAATVRALLAE